MSAQIAPLLQGRLALITGAGGGIGTAIALHFARAGARVVLTDQSLETCEATARKVREAGGEAWAYALDVTDEQACAALAAQVGEEVGAIDTLVNNAGVLIRENIDAPDPHGRMRHLLNVNLMGTFNVLHAWLPALRGNRGCVVNLASAAAFIAQAGCLGYSESKGGVKMLTQTMAVDLAPDGIRVNAIAPGLINTQMSAATQEDPQRYEQFMRRTPLKRMGEPDDIAAPAVFLASDMAAFITGVTLVVDGGLLVA